MSDINSKVKYLEETKSLIKKKIDSTGQNTTNVTFRNYVSLIKNIPNTGAITYDDIDKFTKQAIKISGEKA